MTRLLVAARPVTDVHRDPRNGAEVVTQARLGDLAEALTRRGRWLRLRFRHDRYEGWAPAAGFKPVGRSTRWSHAVSALFANVHAGPSVRAPLRLTAPLGAPLAVVGRARRDGGGARWLRVRMPGGGTGFVLAATFAPAARGRPRGARWRRDLVRDALACRGLPYRWGGTTTFGFDCSGFVQCLWRRYGVLLPRDAHQQAADPRLRPVRRAKLRAGDLLFFARPRGGRVAHVGMAISRGEFVHATTSGVSGVQVNRIADPAWSRRRRVALQYPLFSP